jgi:hypothetical protein
VPISSIALGKYHPDSDEPPFAELAWQS